MIIAAVINRLKQEVSELATVESLATLEDSSRIRSRLPAAFVYQAGRSASRNTALNAVVQERTLTVEVALVAQSRSKASKAALEIDGLVESVDGALIGWSPAENYSPLTAADGQIVDVNDGVVTRVERYQTTTQIRA